MLDQDSQVEKFPNYLQEAIFICNVAIAIFVTVSLFTYDLTDPGWSKISSKQVFVSNTAGYWGAWLADLLFFFFGYTAYTIPPLYFGMTFSKLLNVRNVFENKLNFIQMFCTSSILILTFSALFSIYISTSEYASGSGGVIGYSIAWYLLANFSIVGASLFLCMFLLIACGILFNFSWINFSVNSFQLIVKLCVICLQKIVKLIPKTKSKLLQNYSNKLAENKQSITFPRIGKLVKKTDEVAIKTVDLKQVKQNNKRIEKQSLTPVEFTLGVNAANLNNSLPSLDLLHRANEVNNKPAIEKLTYTAKLVESQLSDFGILAKVVAVHPGPVITRFELQLAAGTKVSKISALSKDLARALSAVSVRIVEVIPGKSVIGLEIPNAKRNIVRLHQILATKEYKIARSFLSLALGKDISGNPVVVDLVKMPHLLVAGTTGSGKSVGLNTMLLSLLYKSTINELRLILIDPKMLEFAVYEGIPHLLTPVVTDMKEAASALRWCVAEMERRYKLMAASGVRNITSYNEKINAAKPKSKSLFDDESSDINQEIKPLPYIVVIADEFADMMMVVGKKVEQLIARIAQKARAAGIHLILATQRPSVDVVTGLIKANIPTRIGFQVSSRIDSRTVLDQQGAEQLLGHGDMLYLPPGSGIPIRVHGAFVDDDEIHRVVEQLKSMGPPEYIDEIVNTNDDSEDIPGVSSEQPKGGEQDELYNEAVLIVTKSRKASISNVQRRLRIGYNRAATLVDAMEEAGVVSKMENNGSREVLAPAPRED